MCRIGTGITWPVMLIASARGSLFKGVSTMSEQEQSESGSVPMMQKLLDNPFLLLFIGVASPSVLYLVWGIMEIVTIPAR